MKTVFVLIASLISFSAGAADKCLKYQDSPRYIKAIQSVAAYTNYQMKELCNLPTVWDIEAQPDRVFTRDGEKIPHVRVQLHREFDSCLYMVRDSDQEITSARCYSGT